MKKKKKYILFSILAAIFLGAVSLICVLVLNNENKLSSEERNWINDNINNVQNVYVAKDKDVFSGDGIGVYYDLLDDFSLEYGLKINPITFEESDSVDGIKLNITHNLDDNDKLLYTDHYVVLSHDKQDITNIDEFNDKKVGVLLSNLDYVKSYLKNINIEYIYYETEDELINSLGTDVDYIMVPRLQNINLILSKGLEVVYHLSDINDYYVYEGNDQILSSILTKYLNKWMEDSFDISFNENELNLFKTSLDITDTDIDELLSVDYNYGFINNSPYEVIMSGNYGGIVSTYLQDFSELTNVKFNITKYKNKDNLLDNLNKGKIDIYFDYNTNIDSSFVSTNNGIKVSLSIITNKDNMSAFNSIYGLIGKDVYVEEKSALYSFLASIGDIKLHTYKNNIELFDMNDKDRIIVVDKYVFDYYKNNKLDNYVSKYDYLVNKSYTFRVNKDYDILYTLLDKYISVLDPSELVNDGMNSHEEVVKNGILLNGIAKYTIISIIVLLIGGYVILKRSKKVRISKKIKKDDKLRFIDQLTSLKNRNYLSDFIKDWNNNTIYPQTILVVDLNKIQDINDKYGVDEGDKQIQACANALIKTQIDNSEVMRSDGNEFVVYLVGYTQKQITNYIHKLNREFKKLPYPYGAEFGYSFIENDLKTIEDALNEAIEDMKKQKGVKNGK